MSNGGGIIIIRNLAATPGVTPEEQSWLNELGNLYEASPEHRCSREDAWRLCALVYRLLR